jgi:hypothetical protein
MLEKFFIICSGADKPILDACPTEKTKFVGIGATIFLTACLAAISGGYAIYFTFNDFRVSLIFGLFWGIIIFNLDRYIVSSIKKTGNFLNELLTASPRLLIAVVLAITISKPLEIKLFDGSITKKMGQNEDEYNKGCVTNFNSQRANLDNTKSELEKERDSKKNSIYVNDPIKKDIGDKIPPLNYSNSDLRERIKTNNGIIGANTDYKDGEINPKTGIAKRIAVPNSIAISKMGENRNLNSTIAENNFKIKSLTDSLNKRDAELMNQTREAEKQYALQIAGVQHQIDDMNANRGAILLKCKTEAALDKDILSRLRALSELKSFGNPVWWASLLITILFILLETSPILVKLLSKRGPYDEILERVEYEIFLNQQKIISDKNDEINNILAEIKEVNKLKGEVRMKTEKAKLTTEMKANESLLDYIATKQAELGKIAVDNWYAEESKKMQGNQKNQQPNSPKFEDVQWKESNSKEEIFYLFKNGQPSNNTLVYNKNVTNQFGKWEYVSLNDEIKIDLPLLSETYFIENLTNDSVKLRTKSNEIIELIKV